MFKKSYLLSILLIAILILGACGTPSEEDSSPGTTPDEEKQTEEQENNDNEGNTAEEETESTTEEDDEEATDQDNTEENDTTIDSDENEEKTNELQTNAEQVDSDVQDYSIQILPAYTLTSEEPGKDSLFLTEDGNIFMRIETMPFDQESYDFFKENTLTLLEGIKADGKTVADSTALPTGENINDSVGYTVETNENMLTGLVFEKDGLLVRLTIFDTLAEEHFKNFLQMGETITNK